MSVLHDDLRLEKFNLRYIPHLLETNQKQARVERSPERASPDARTRTTIRARTHMNRGRKPVLFEYFMIRAGPQIQMTCLKFRSKQFNPKSASFRLFRVAQGLKVCCICSERHEIEYDLLYRIGCPGFGGTCLSRESAENASRHYGPSGQCMTAQKQKK
jgi:hypothetical protein